MLDSSLDIENTTRDWKAKARNGGGQVQVLDHIVDIRNPILQG